MSSEFVKFKQSSTQCVMLILLISNHMVFLVQFGINLHLWVFQKLKLHHLLKNSLMQINSKLNSKPYDYLHKLLVSKIHVFSWWHACKKIVDCLLTVGWNDVDQVPTGNSKQSTNFLQACHRENTCERHPWMPLVHMIQLNMPEYCWHPIENICFTTTGPGVKNIVHYTCTVNTRT